MTSVQYYCLPVLSISIFYVQTKMCIYPGAYVSAHPVYCGCKPLYLYTILQIRKVLFLAELTQILDDTSNV